MPSTIKENDSTQLRTLQDALSALDDVTSLTPTQKRDGASAIRAIGRVLNHPLDSIPAELALLRYRLNDIHYANAGISRKRWQNIRASLVSTLRILKNKGYRVNYYLPLSPAWKRCYDCLDTKRRRNGLSSFIHYCNDHNISPGSVDDETVDEFMRYLETHTLRSKPRQVHRCTCRLWNEAVEHYPAWPDQRLTVPSYKQPRKTLDWASFPLSLRDEVQRHLDWLGGKDLLADHQPPRICKPSTIRLREKQIHMMASAAVQGGVVIEQINSLKTLVERETVKAAVNWYFKQNQQQTTVYQKDLVVTLYAIARHWVRVGNDHLEWLKVLITRLNPKQGGLTDKNRAALRQFDESTQVRRLLQLPEQLVNKADKLPSPKRQAVAVQIALAIELLLMAPMRINNLVSLELGKQVILPHRKGGPVTISLCEHEVKNEFAQEYPLPEETSALLHLYLSVHRPHLLKHPDATWLFPGDKGGHKLPQTMALQISQTLSRELGLTLTPHQFRHLAAKLQLDAHPGSYETVRRLLGHKSIKTTTHFYTGLESRQAVAHFDQLLTKIRNG
ncbi:MAG: site-specific integrase [Shewanella sp.]|nr:site-specific integrase [Shewanella sp.]MCG7935444.1 site-specific integrase [Candidatus Thiodiazotropha taylori]